MKLIEPVTITRDKILRSNVPGEEWQPWVAAGPPELANTYSYAGAIDANSALLWGSVSTPPCVIRPADFTAVYASSGDFRAAMNGKAPPPVSPDGTEVAFVTNGGSNVSVYNAATLALKRTNNPAVGGGAYLRGTQSVLFSPDGQRIVIALRSDNPITGIPLPAFLVIESSLSPNRYMMRGFFTPPGYEPSYINDYPDGYMGYIGIGCMSFISNTTIVYGLMSRDGNELGRGLYELDITNENATPQQVLSESGALFEYTAVNRCAASGHIAVVKHDRYGTGYSSLEILNSSYSVIATPYATSDGVRITSVSWSHDGAQLVVTTNLAPRARVLNASSSYAVAEQYPEPFIARLGSYLYQPGTQGYLATYPAGVVLTGEGEPYSLGDTITRDDRVYESLISNNTDVPELGAKQDPPTWVYLGYVNDMKPFDGVVGDQAVSDESGVLEITLKPQDVIAGVALFNVTGETVRLVIREPNEGVVFDTGEIDTVDSSNVEGYFDYFFGPYNTQNDFTFALQDFSFVDLPAYYDAEITITISSTTRESKVGEIVVGNVINLGDLKWGAGYGIIDFSIKGRDSVGNYEVQEGDFSRDAEFDVSLPSAFTSSFINTLARFRARPAVFIGSVFRPESIIYGFYTDFSVVTSNHAFTDATVTVESLI